MTQNLFFLHLPIQTPNFSRHANMFATKSAYMQNCGINLTCWSLVDKNNVAMVIFVFGIHNDARMGHCLGITINHMSQKTHESRTVINSSFCTLFPLKVNDIFQCWSMIQNLLSFYTTLKGLKSDNPLTTLATAKVKI